MKKTNKEKREAVIFFGGAFIFVNAFLFALRYFEQDQTNKEGIGFVHLLLDATFTCVIIVVILANVFFPKDNDEPDEEDD